jgi:hypothetical protein
MCGTYVGQLTANRAGILWGMHTLARVGFWLAVAILLLCALPGNGERFRNRTFYWTAEVGGEWQYMVKDRIRGSNDRVCGSVVPGARAGYVGGYALGTYTSGAARAATEGHVETLEQAKAAVASQCR